MNNLKLNMNKIIIYGDLHGCLDEFKQLRAKVNPTKNDKEIIIGDIVDRGLKSNELLEYVRENKISSIMGNHEYKYIRYKKHQDVFIKTGKKNPIKLDEKQQYIYDNLSSDDFKYLNSLSLFIKLDNLTLVHAGITNNINLDTALKKDLEKILWIRYLDKSQNPISLYDNHKDAKLWSESYNGNQGIIVYGHNVFDEVRLDKYSVGIDTGCAYGGRLTALIINDTNNPLDYYEIIDIQSKKEYAINKY